MEIKRLTEEEYRVIYLCDDMLGMKIFLSQEINRTGRELDNFLAEMIRKGLIRRSDIQEEIGEWYYSTQTGKKYLKLFHDQYEGSIL